MDRTNETLLALRRILRVTELHRREVARSVGLTSVQLHLLKLIKDAQCATAKMLADQMRVSQATVTALLDKLESRGMIARKVSVSDRRQKLILLTPKGGGALNNVHDPMQRNFRQQFERLEDWEQSMLLAAVERISALLDADTIDDAPLLTPAGLVDDRGTGVLEILQDDHH